ncbi:MAG: transglycosylase SLT domain-containing protein [bacterium]|nr:transglycosylase SLT domain-containing protein [bacterium]
MNDFLHGLYHGFVGSMLNRMRWNFMPLNYWNSYPYQGGLSMFNSYSQQNNLPMATFTSLAQTQMNSSPMSVWDYAITNFPTPNFGGLPNYNQYFAQEVMQNYIPSFTPGFTPGAFLNYAGGQEMFNSGLKTSKKTSQGASTSRYSDSDTSNFSYDADTLKQKWSKKKSGLSQGFYNKVVQVAKRIKCSPDDLMALMNSESNLNPASQNPSSNATGLIQFMPSTAMGLGTSVENLKTMSAEQQLVYVEKYFLGVKKSAGYKDTDTIGAGTLYALTFLPKFAKQDILVTKNNDPNGYYRNNAGLDFDKDGKITKADLAKQLDKKRA